MLLVLDVGNTNTVLGVFAKVARGAGAAHGVESAAPRYELLVANWRVATVATQTVDEYGVLFRNLFAMGCLEAKGIHGIVISSVVPPLDSRWGKSVNGTSVPNHFSSSPALRPGCPCTTTTLPKWAPTAS